MIVIGAVVFARPAPAFAVEKAKKMSPEPFPDVPPVLAIPMEARRASRFN
jgi:hypothetical protein